MANDWQLPDLTHLSLTRGELLCIEWFTCGDYLLKLGYAIDDVIDQWHAFRGDVWAGIHALADWKPGTVTPPPPPPEYRLFSPPGVNTWLFNFLPPSFAWGTGEDVGFTLKWKLYKLIHGITEVAGNDDSATQATDKPTDPSQS